MSQTPLEFSAPTTPEPWPVEVPSETDEDQVPYDYDPYLPVEYPDHPLPLDPGWGTVDPAWPPQEGSLWNVVPPRDVEWVYCHEDGMIAHRKHCPVCSSFLGHYNIHALYRPHPSFIKARRQQRKRKRKEKIAFLRKSEARFENILRDIREEKVSPDFSRRQYRKANGDPQRLLERAVQLERNTRLERDAQQDSPRPRKCPRLATPPLIESSAGSSTVAPSIGPLAGPSRVAGEAINAALL
jgi:hypothetical protein